MTTLSHHSFVHLHDTPVSANITQADCQVSVVNIGDDFRIFIKLDRIPEIIATLQALLSPNVPCDTYGCALPIHDPRTTPHTPALKPLEGTGLMIEVEA